MHLSREDFLAVVTHAPLVSIDLVVRDPSGAVLLGLRANRPAQGWWFVPGGRIRKGERVAEAFARVAREELGVGVPFGEARPLGVYDHLYDDHFAGEGVGTHYVVLGYEVRLAARPADLPGAQHREYRWQPERELLASADVHPNTRAYFTSR